MTPTEIKDERSSTTLIIIFLTAALFGLNECSYQIRVDSYEDCIADKTETIIEKFTGKNYDHCSKPEP